MSDSCPLSCLSCLESGGGQLSSSLSFQNGQRPLGLYTKGAPPTLSYSMWYPPQQTRSIDPGLNHKNSKFASKGYPGGDKKQCP
ncbi:hypothetical protein J6590_085617 [Homalodisca vitripennis]|nr:hypothetical protein J6590_085617 [Homalodisca vitripennis]